VSTDTTDKTVETKPTSLRSYRGGRPKGVRNRPPPDMEPEWARVHLGDQAQAVDQGRRCCQPQDRQHPSGPTGQRAQRIEGGRSIPLDRATPEDVERFRIEISASDTDNQALAGLETAYRLIAAGNPEDLPRAGRMRAAISVPRCAKYSRIIAGGTDATEWWMKCMTAMQFRVPNNRPVRVWCVRVRGGSRENGACRCVRLFMEVRAFASGLWLNWRLQTVHHARTNGGGLT